MSQPDIQEPPRWKWTKRSLACFAIWSVALAVGWVGWARYADREFQQYRQIADPPPAAFDIVTDADNAAPLYLHALDLLARSTDSPANSRLYYDSWPPYPLEWWKMAEQANQRNAQFFELIREATGRPYAVWSQDPVLIRRLIANFDGTRYARNALSDAAILAHLKGDEHRALQLLHDQISLIDRLPDQPDMPTFTARADGLTSAAENIQLMAGTLMLSSAENRASAEALLQKLIQPHDDQLQKLFSYATLYPARYALNQQRGWIIAPHVKLESAKLVRARQNFLTQVAEAPNLGAARLKILGYTPPPMWRSYSSGLGNSADSAVLREFQQLVGALALAVRLYELDHGQPPATLAPLVPSYLKALPIDPYDPAGGPLKMAWRRCSDGVSRPAIYSVGANGRDDTAAGLQTLSPNPMQYAFDRRIDIALDVYVWNEKHLPLNKPLPHLPADPSEPK